MKKALAGGCDALHDIVDRTLKRGCVGLLFHLSELRGRATWKRKDYANVLGVSVDALDALILSIQELLIEAEEFVRALQETRQDFALLFDWISERIRVHTNASTNAGGVNGGPALSSGAGQYHNESSNSLLNQRRLCDFLQRAAQAAYDFQRLQPVHNKFKVEPTFGNPISRRFLCSALNAAPLSMDPGTSGRLLVLITRVEDAWVTLAKQVATSVASVIGRDDSGCFAVDGLANEFHLEFLPGDDRGSSSGVYQRIAGPETCDDDTLEDDEDDDDGIDWEAFKSFGKSPSRRSPVVLTGYNASNRLILLRGSSSNSGAIKWEAAAVAFTSDQWASGSSIPHSALVKSFGFYSNNKPDGEASQIATLLTRDASATSSNSNTTGTSECECCVYSFKPCLLHI
jgi:hypothetical protein